MDLHRALPDAWNVFFRLRQPRPMQVEAMPILVRGTSALLSAPTASGKTEAVFAPLYQRHVSFKRGQLSVVYVAPTKALVNDMRERLLSYFGSTNPDSIVRYTGDHHEVTTADGGFVVLATPEALDSLQLTKPHLLAHVRAVFIDELHLLDGTARGQQLRAVLGRLRQKLTPHEGAKDVFQVVGTTATVRDIEVVAERWCGPGAIAIRNGSPRDIDLEEVGAPPARRAAVLAERFRTANASKLLVFCQTRNSAHQLAAELNECLAADRIPVHLHIGIVAKGERERIESAMRRERRAVCVATSTLEVGIDIGDIDIVALAEPPRSVNSYVQRVGRGNRRAERCVVWGMAVDDEERATYRALNWCAARGYLDDVHEYWRPSVDFQQILSLSWAAGLTESPLTRANLGRRSGGMVREEVLDDMLSTGVLTELRGAILPSQDWQDLGDRRAIHTVIVGAAGLPIVDLPTGETIGQAGAPGMRGHLYTGGRLRPVRGDDAEGVYVGTARGGVGRQLVNLPSIRGRRRGMSRPVVWALAELSGQDPRRWTNAAGTVTTWGGTDFNTVLAALLSKVLGTKLEASPVAIRGVPEGLELNPPRALTLLQEHVDTPIPLKVAARFREPSAFFTHLSPSMQRAEIRGAVPLPGTRAWLEELAKG